MAATLESGKVTAFKNSNASFTPVTLGATSSIGTITGGDFVGWGIWVTGSRTDLVPNTTAADRLHYVVGIPTLSGLMPTTGTAAYSLIGSTAPTRDDGASGVLTGATFSADFGTGKVSTTLSGTFVGSTFSVSGSNMSIAGSSFSSSQISGNFFGANAARAGLVYSGADSMYKYFSGSAVFQK